MSAPASFLDLQTDALRGERASLVMVATALLDEIKVLSDDAAVDITSEDGFGEGAGSAVEQDRDRALHVQAMARIDEIDAALSRIAQGTYGHCDICGGEIGQVRLEALPTATQCVTCKAGGLSVRHRRGLHRTAA